MRFFSLLTAFTLMMANLVSGQSLLTTNETKNPPPSVEVEEKDVPEWSFSASVSAYSIPDAKDYISPLFTADRDWLHMEARFNYENIDTASVWLGYNFSVGEKLVLDFTPMVGGVFGHTRGIAPGWRLALSRGAFELTSEAEYVFDSQDSENNFFYMWSELTWSPVDWLWIGLAGQRTRLFHSDLDIQRGFLVGCSFKKMDFTGYVFNWGWGEPAFVFTIGRKF